MNNAKNLFDCSTNILKIDSDRSIDSGIINKHFFSLCHGSYVANRKVYNFGYDLYMVDGPNSQEVYYCGELAKVECYKTDYDPYVDFMFYKKEGVALVDKNLNVVYHSQTEKMFEDKKSLIKLVCLYGPSVLVYMNPTDYLDKRLQNQINGAFKERVKMLREKGATVFDVTREKIRFDNVVQEIQKQAQKELGISY